MCSAAADGQGLTSTDSCSNYYIAPFLAQIGWLKGEELKRVQQEQHKSSFGKQQHRMLPNRSWAPRDESTE